MDYRRFIRQAMMLTLTTGLLASCSKEENVGEPEADELIEIIPSAVYTRGDGGVSNVGSITGPVDNSMLEQLTFYFTRGDYDDGWITYTKEIYPATCKYRENSTTHGDINFETPQYYLSNGSDTKMIGWYPQGELSTSDQNPTLTILFNGQTDILLSNSLTGNKSDLLINGPDNLFTFKHQLTQLQFHVKAESYVAAGQWGKIKSIIFKNECDEYQYQIERNRSRFAISDNQSNTPIALTTTESIDINSKENQFGLIMLQPNEDASLRPIELTIITELNNQQITSTVEIDEGEFLAGHAYKVILNFKQGPTTITFEPAEWRELEQPIELGENLSHVISDMNYIVSRTMFGNANDYNGEILTVRDELWDTTPPEESKESVPVILEVATKDIEGKKTWEEACNACPEGWRLPCKKELQLIQQYKDMLTKVNTDDQTLNTPNGEYWSATLVSTGKAYYLNMEEPTEQTSSTEETYKVRCVRDVEM